MKSLIAFVTRFIPRKYLHHFTGISTSILKVLYKGKTYHCPVCEGDYRSLLPYGRIVSRKNALCPGCLSLERHRLLWLYLKEQTDFFSEDHDLLHIAPEPCFQNRFRKMRNLNYTTGDLNSPLADVKMDIHSMPFDQASFDIVLCNHVLEHVEDDKKAMREIFRVLKPGGWAILQVPFFYPIPDKTIEDLSITDPKEREKRFGQDDHVRKYGKDYPERIAEAGFQVISDDYVKSFDAEEMIRYALPENEIIYKAVKR